MAEPTTHEQQKERLIQGFVGVLAGGIISVSLLYPWVTVENSQINGLVVGDIFAQFARTQFLKLIPNVLLLFGMLTILGGLLHIEGYKMSKLILNISSVSAFVLSTFVAVAFGTFPIEISITFELSPWICIFGAMLGLISIRLER